jgi:exopolyphosphatase
VLKDLAVPLIQTERANLTLRAENLYALELAGLSEPTKDLLCIDDIPPHSHFPSVKFAIVDHNHLHGRFTENNPKARVLAIIDHHEDEGQHKETADPRIIVVPTGSSASLVAHLLSEECSETVPKELATLLLCAILVDTGGLKPGGKAEPIDRQAAAYLAPRSLFSTVASLGSTDIHEEPQLQELTTALHAKKDDVSHLGTRDLLRRDYKEYSLKPFWQPDKTVLVGLSSIPIGLHPWISNDTGFWSAVEDWMQDRQLSALGILTSFRDEKKMNKHGKGKHRREQLYVVRDGDVEGLSGRLFKGLKHFDELELKQRSLADDYGTGGPSLASTLRAKVWEQGNTDATRKVTAPLVKRVIEGPTTS